MSMEMLRISAVVCTHNRVEHLAEVLRSLQEQTLDPERFEILVVDNRSNDGTAALVRDIAEKQSNLRYLLEPEIGLSHARNLGWRNARAPFVAYLDDDAVAAPDWLERISLAFERVLPTPGCVCGRVAPIWGKDRPAWLNDRLGRYFSILERQDPPGWLADNAFCGANMAFPRAVLAKLDGFDTALGRRGANLLSNEELLMSKRLRASGPGIYYDPAIAVRHHIAAARLTRGWIIRRVYWQGVSDAIVWRRLEAPDTTHRLKAAVRSLRPIFVLGGRLARNLARGDTKRVFDAALRLVGRGGYLIGLLALEHAP
ncbi:glycosyltransferase family 2 protein [Thiocapsa bogorovii]|uniref:glycosyltransferase family 2 protein n=1 Tax=Thiocapsa bogorovii TaxID=521689 RepID=UPI001E2B736F|nr:glycosyltransferase [Thiocapsa bogorovii]UHD15870.1 glycosyltransferase [Thiocapsa bogorovii]